MFGSLFCDIENGNNQVQSIENGNNQVQSICIQIKESKMSQVLEELRNQLFQRRKASQKGSNKSTNKSKQNDYIFKRYRYEQNTIINSFNQNTTNKYTDHYNQPNQNDLIKFKKELQNQTNHFDLVDFAQFDDQPPNPKHNPQKHNHSHSKTFNLNHFHHDQQNPINIHQLPLNCDQPAQLNSKYTPNSKNTQEQQIKPMQLVDFGEQDQDQILDPTPVKFIQASNLIQSHFHQNPNLTFSNSSSNSQDSDKSFSQSPISESFTISPDQSLYINSNLQKSVSKFLRKGTRSQKIQNDTYSQKCFQNQKVGSKNYEFQKISQSDNPFKDAVDYSNDQELKGIKIYHSPVNQNMKVQIYDKDLFVSSKIPPGIILKCKLKRSKGFFSLMDQQFDLYLQNGLKHLISARKNLFRNRQLFHFSTKMSNFQYPIRTLMANILHNSYWLLDAPRVIDKKKISYLDLLIEYKSLDQQSKKEREMMVLCPPMLKTYHIGLQYDVPSLDFQWFKKNIALRLYFKGQKQTKIKSSIKNFQLVDSEDDQDKDDEIQQMNDSNSIFNPKKQACQSLVNDRKEGDKDESYLYLKMQKESQNVFDVEIQHPLTPLQAMAIILTRFDAQLK